MTDIAHITEALRESGGFPVEVDGVRYGCDWLICEVDIFSDKDGMHIGSEKIVRRVDNYRAAEATWQEWLEAFDFDNPGRSYTIHVRVHNHPLRIYRYVPDLAREWLWWGTADCNC